MGSLVGQNIGRYHIIEQLGEGGMAVVYKAYDTTLECDVAFKIIRTEKLAPDSLERTLVRFKNEAKKTARLSHPNIINVTDYGDHENAPYLVMKYLPGGTLQDRLEASDNPMDYREAARLLAPIARALETAHRSGIVHRDVKPSNILLADGGEPMLTDFGIAQVTGEMRRTMELTGVFAIGTPEYMAPEQWEAKAVDGRADVYALAVVFYELVTGRPPYVAETVPALMVKALRDPLPSPRKYVKDLPEDVERVLIKALTKDPDNRYQDMGAFASALEKLAYGGVVDGGDRKFPRWLGYSLAGLGVIAVVVGGLFFSGVIGERDMTELAGSANAVTPTLEGTSSTATEETTIIAEENDGEGSEHEEETVPITTSETPPDCRDIGQTWVSPKDGMTLVCVPIGKFSMGSFQSDTPSSTNDEELHSVYLDAYWIDRTEVTNAMYVQCVQEGACWQPDSKGSSTRGDYYRNPDYDNYPVVNVDWRQANAYCEWAGRRLPTEAEWEKAARGTEYQVYPWGDKPDCELAQYGGEACDREKDTAETGSYPDGASPYGALDMAGNAAEWVADWYGEFYYRDSPDENPGGPASGEVRVIKGGSYTRTDTYIRSGGRLRGEPRRTSDYIGFRCIYSLLTLTEEDFMAVVPTPFPTLDTTSLPTTEYLANASVIFEDSFDTFSSANWWKWKVGKSAENGVLRINGTSDWPNITRGEYHTEGEASLALFKFSSNAHFGMFAHHGTWNMSTYQDWGLDYSNGQSTTRLHKESTSNIGGQRISGSLQLRPDQWYYILLSVEGPSEFYMRLWEPENPERFSEYRWQLDEEWAEANWRFTVNIGSGSIDIDQYQELRITD